MTTVRNILASLREIDKYPYYRQIEILQDEPNLMKLPMAKKLVVLLNF